MSTFSLESRNARGIFLFRDAQGMLHTFVSKSPAFNKADALGRWGSK